MFCKNVLKIRTIEFNFIFSSVFPEKFILKITFNLIPFFWQTEHLVCQPASKKMHDQTPRNINKAPQKFCEA